MIKNSPFKQTKGLPLIGKGMFTLCYDNGDNVLLVSNCPIKECNALGWLSDSRLFPKIEGLDCSDELQLFKQEKFAKVKSLKTALQPKEYSLYLQLRELASAFQCKWVKNKFDRKDVFVDTVRASKLNHVYKKALIEAAEGITNYTTKLGFEVSPRNVAVKNGKLILLDVFFSLDQLEINTANKRR
jgi:hypothetical protein